MTKFAKELTMDQPLTQKTGSSAGKWIGYSTMAAGVLAVGQKANAQVFSVDVDPDTVVTNGVFEVDFDGDAIVDISVVHSGTSMGGIVAVIPPAGGNNALLGPQPAGSFLYPSALASGAPIGAAQNFESQGGTLAYALNGANIYGVWDGITAFLGCRFVAGDGEAHYGWFQITTAPSAGSATILAYGYETMPGVAIAAGDVAEPFAISELGTAAFNATVTPNPVNDRAVIELNTTKNGPVRIALLNSTGEKLMSMEAGNNARPELDMSPYAAGVYFVRLQSGKQVNFQKVVKQ
ncbi:MAG: T9SS type A sorting domain-containing protein [Flavobacteriales bacterium]|nr:T9SS type A sorting domain-containing protein [Flavobacteriales bacterium]